MISEYGQSMEEIQIPLETSILADISPFKSFEKVCKINLSEPKILPAEYLLEIEDPILEV